VCDIRDIPDAVMMREDIKKKKKVKIIGLMTI